MFKIITAVRKVKNLTIKELENRGLLSLYLAGTILSRKERTKYSDIDLFGIVKSSFDMDEEGKLNKKLKKLEKEIGFECRFRAFPLDTLNGGRVKGVSKFLHPK